ncbi:MAG: hypothetical protein WDO16_12210 [Bacteroidota bacterium]
MTDSRQTQIKKDTVLVIHKFDQDWLGKIGNLGQDDNLSVEFKEDRHFDLKSLRNNKYDFIVLPLTLNRGKAFLIAKHVHASASNTKLLLCSNTNLPETEICNVFDGFIARDGVDADKIRSKIEILRTTKIKRIADESDLNHRIASIIVNEGAFGPNNQHGQQSVYDSVFSKKDPKFFLRSYLFIVLITMICGLYSFADSVYKQVSGTKSNDLTMLWLTIIPTIAAIVFASHHHDIPNNYFTKREKIIYLVLAVLWIWHICYFFISTAPA